MQITRGTCEQHTWKKLRDFHRGECVIFKHQFHQDMCASDPYMKVDASAYPNRDEQGKSCVVNLRTGKMSYVQHTRDVRAVEAEVCIHE